MKKPRYLLKFVGLICLTTLVCFNRTVIAQTSELVLYDSLNGAIVRVGIDGTEQSSFTLPSSSPGTYPLNVALSPDGITQAYMTYTAPPALNILQGQTQFVYPLPTDVTANSLAFAASPDVFSVDGQHTAFAYAQADGTWRIDLLDTAQQWTPIASLDQTSSIPGLLPINVLGRTPIVQAIDLTGQVIFVLAEPFSGFQTNFETTYIWNPVTGDVVRTDVPTALDGDRHNGEQLTLLFDETMPNSAGAFTYPQANTLYLTNSIGERFLVFNTANVSMFWARFVSDGEFILVGSFSPENRIAWLLLNRNGDVIGDFPSLQMTGVIGTSTGFAYTVDAGANQGSILYHVDATSAGAGEPQELWNSPVGVSYRVIGVG